MGMDVVGKNPKADNGREFRSNVWWWHGLAEYCQKVAPDVASKCKHWHTNDGDGLGEAASKKLANALLKEIKSGKCAEHEIEFKRQTDSLPVEECKFCHGTGSRNDSIGLAGGQPLKKITEEGHPREGQIGWCNGCDGHGVIKSTETWYHFSVEHVKEFAEFLAFSGGFRIY